MGQAGDGGGQHGSNARGRCGMVGTVWEKRKEDTKVTDSVIRFFTCHKMDGPPNVLRGKKAVTEDHR